MSAPPSPPPTVAPIFGLSIPSKDQEESERRRRRYCQFSGPSLLCIPTITTLERRRLWAAARTFDKRPATQIESLRRRVNGYAAKQSTDKRQMAVRKKSAAKYVDKMDPAISGCNGHSKAFAVACVLVGKFGLTFDESLEIFHEYNKRCDPPWSEKEILHKLESAMEAAK